MTEFIVGDRVWVKNPDPNKNETRYPGIVERIYPDQHQLTVQIESGPKLRVYVAVVTLRETHE